MLSYIVELNETHITPMMCEKYGWKNNGYKTIEYKQPMAPNGIEVVEATEIESDKKIEVYTLTEHLYGFDVILREEDIMACENRYLFIYMKDIKDKMKILTMLVPPFLSYMSASKIVRKWVDKKYDNEYDIFAYAFEDSVVDIPNLYDFYDVASKLTETGVNHGI